MLCYVSCQGSYAAVDMTLMALSYRVTWQDTWGAGLILGFLRSEGVEKQWIECLIRSFCKGKKRGDRLKWGWVLKVWRVEKVEKVSLY